MFTNSELHSRMSYISRDNLFLGEVSMFHDIYGPMILPTYNALKSRFEK